MLSLGFAIGIALASSPQSSGVKWVPLNAPKPPPKVAPPPAPAPAPAPAPQSQAAPKTQPVASVAPPATSAPTIDRPLQISCFGSGTADKKKVVSTYGSSSFSGIAGTTTFSGSGSGTSWTVLPHDRQFRDQVDIRLFSGDDRIRLPRTLLPPIHGGSAGWFKLKHVVADARSIRASAAINFMNNPKVFIDRVTGTISISGRAGDYSGQCEVVDESKPKF
jgi:hypothetical protein